MEVIVKLEEDEKYVEKVSNFERKRKSPLAFLAAVEYHKSCRNISRSRYLRGEAGDGDKKRNRRTNHGNFRR